MTGLCCSLDSVSGSPNLPCRSRHWHTLLLPPLQVRKSWGMSAMYGATFQDWFLYAPKGEISLSLGWVWKDSITKQVAIKISQYLRMGCITCSSNRFSLSFFSSFSFFPPLVLSFWVYLFGFLFKKNLKFFLSLWNILVARETSLLVMGVVQRHLQDKKELYL